MKKTIILIVYVAVMLLFGFIGANAQNSNEAAGKSVIKNFENNFRFPANDVFSPNKITVGINMFKQLN